MTMAKYHNFFVLRFHLCYSIIRDSPKYEATHALIHQS